MGVFLEAVPLFFCKLHSLPVVIPGGVLLAKLSPPGFVSRAFGGRDVRLKLDCGSAGVGNGVNKGVGHTDATIMALRYFADDQATSGRRLAAARAVKERFSEIQLIPG